jgi:hypothetical protein
MSPVPPSETQPAADHLLDDRRLAEVLAELERSPRVRLETIARSHQGRPITMIIVAEPEVLAGLEGHRRGALEPEQRNTTVPSVLYAGDSWGHEASQVEGLIEAARRLAFDESEEVRLARSRSIALIIPLMNPDGRAAALREWQATPLSNGDSGAGNAYGFLLNRDFVHGTQPEARGVIEAVMRYRPVAVLDLHEDMFNLGVRLPEVAFVEPFAPGADYEEHSLTRSAIVDLGRAIAERWRAAGFKALYAAEGENTFAPLAEPGKGLNPMAGSAGRLNLMSTLHAIPSFITESARSPGTQTWEDRVEQKASAVLAMLAEVSARPVHYLGVVQERRRLEEHAGGDRFVVIPEAGQPFDGLDVLLDLLRLHRIGVHRVQTPYPAFVVPLAQPESRMARHLLLGERSPLNELPPALGVRIVSSDGLPAHEASQFRSAAAGPALFLPAAVQHEVAYRLQPSPRVYVLVNRLLASGAARVSHHKGQFHFEGNTPAIRWEASKLEVPLEGAPPAGDGGLRSPRLAVYTGQGVPLGESGEILWALDAGGFSYQVVDAGDVANRRALDGIDVLIVPNGSAQEIVAGWDPEASNRRAPWELSEPAGGIGEPGLDAVRRFVEGGGVYVGLGAGGAALAGAGYLEIARVDFAPAAVGLGQVRLHVAEPESPLLFGYDGEAPLPACIYAPPGTNSAGYAFSAADGAVAFYDGIRGTNDDQTFISTEPLSASAGNAAIVHQRFGSGQVVLFGIAPAFRGQWQSTFGLLFNAVFLRQ